MPTSPACRVLLILSAFGLACLPISADPPKRPTGMPPAEAFRSDYLEACRLVATRHVLLEEKTGLSRTAYQKRLEPEVERIQEADPRVGFIQAMTALRASIADGHLDWSLGNGLENPRSQSLGVILTVEDGRLRVGRTTANQAMNLHPGDEILAWDGLPASEALARMARRIPQSTADASLEEAARMLTFQPAWQPIHSSLAPVQVAYRTVAGQTGEALLPWDDNTLPLTRNGRLSLEEIPPDAEAIHPSLFLYFRTVGGRIVAILHPRAFSNWTAQDVDRAMTRILARKPAALVIDLKDSAGGSFEQVSILGKAVGMPHPLRWTLQSVDPTSGRIAERTQAYEAEDGPHRSWKGTLLVRTNPVCGSGCDYFAHGVQSSGIGRILGRPSAGRGLGTDDFTLGGTGTTLTLPLRQRILLPDRATIEGHGVQPDFPFAGDLAACLEAYFSRQP